MSPRRYLTTLLGLSFACAAAGCGVEKNEFDVSGSVTIDGQPVPRGTITFVAVDGQTPTGGGVIKEGQYTAKVPPGEKVVTVLGNKLVGQEPSLRGVPDSTPQNKYETVTPLEYNAAHVSPLKASIDGHQEGLNFELTKSIAKKTTKRTSAP